VEQNCLAPACAMTKSNDCIIFIAKANPNEVITKNDRDEESPLAELRNKKKKKTINARSCYGKKGKFQTEALLKHANHDARSHQRLGM
jgi:hypothetical protein